MTYEPYLVIRHEALKPFKCMKILNNNPIYVCHSSIQWKGMIRVQSDPRFVQFKSEEYGYCAAFLLFFMYRQMYGCNTIRKFMSAWSSPYAIKLEYLVKCVSYYAGIDADKPLAGYDWNAYIRIMCALSYELNGCRAKKVRVCKGLWYAIRYHEQVLGG